jgi:hypothetical protein
VCVRFHWDYGDVCERNGESLREFITAVGLPARE